MKKFQTLIVIGIVFAVLFTGSIFFTFADEGTLQLSGITVKDEHPNGCVDCHKNAGDGRDYRLSVELKASGHPDISKIVKTIPGDCAMCHKAGSKAGALNLQTHQLHYANPDENHFIEYYQGECLACHSLNLQTGEMSVKSGAKNW